MIFTLALRGRLAALNNVKTNKNTSNNALTMARQCIEGEGQTTHT
jgi:hypothetical protein